MFEASDIQRRDQSPSVLHIQLRFRIYALFRQEIADGRPQKFAIDQDIERYAVFIAMKEVVDKGREIVSGQSCDRASVRVLYK